MFTEMITLENQELIVNPHNKGFADLHIKPVSFGAKSHELVQEIYWLYNTHDETKRESANNWIATLSYLNKAKYAIKTMKKAEIIDSKHVDHIENEKMIARKGRSNAIRKAAKKV